MKAQEALGLYNQYAKLVEENNDILFMNLKVLSTEGEQFSTTEIENNLIMATVQISAERKFIETKLFTRFYSQEVREEAARLLKGIHTSIIKIGQGRFVTEPETGDVK